ncbi:MAG: tyrosine/phenylalanine carboxypeptidase domain-containing protein [archaeon]|jgi:hypothetical protein
MSFVDYRLLDQKIGEIANSSQLNILFFINPQNLEEQRELFFKELKDGNEYNPIFRYPSKNPLYSYFSMKPTFETYKNELKELLSNLGTDSLGILCENKVLDLIEGLELAKSVGTPNFSENSKQFFGAVDKKLLNDAKAVLNAPEKKVDLKKVSFDEAINIIKNFFKKNKLNYTIELRESSISTFSINPLQKVLYINKKISFDENMVKRLIAHEIETHAYRYENGLLQPYSILAQGTSKLYLETDEGLAVNIEKLKNLHIDSQLRTYAGRVLAIDYASKKSFYETFSKLREHFSDDESFNLTLRAKRGTFKTSEPGAFTKDILYFKGMSLVEDFLKDHPLESLYYGRYSTDEYSLVRGVEGLKKPFYMPKFS